MKYLLCFVALAMATVFMSHVDPAPSIGSQVSDEVAASLHGGCAGINKDESCKNSDFCKGTVYTNGSLSDEYDPGSIQATYCKTKVNGEDACKTCSATYVSCNVSKGIAITPL